jgi:hypothetical protein
MGRVIFAILSLIAAAVTAILFGTVAHDELGIAVDTIRTDALTSAGFLFLILAGGSLLRRSK